MCTRIYVYYYYLLLLLVIIKSVVTFQDHFMLDGDFSIYFFLFIYFGHLYIDHHLANIARIGTAINR